MTKKSQNEIGTEVEEYRGSTFSVVSGESLDGYDSIKLSPTLQNKVIYDLELFAIICYKCCCFFFLLVICYQIDTLMK